MKKDKLREDLLDILKPLTKEELAFCGAAPVEELSFVDNVPPVLGDPVLVLSVHEVNGLVAWLYRNGPGPDHHFQVAQDTLKRIYDFAEEHPNETGSRP